MSIDKVLIDYQGAYDKTESHVFNSSEAYADELDQHICLIFGHQDALECSVRIVGMSSAEEIVVSEWKTVLIKKPIGAR